MGEFADMAMEDMFAIDEYSLDGIGDYWSPFYASRYSREPVANKTCRNCEKTGLRWKKFDSRWYLEESFSYTTRYGNQVGWVKHKCQVPVKKAFASMKDPSKEYFKYLDTIPAMTEEDYEGDYL